MKTLTLAVDSFDTVNTFNVNTGKSIPAKCVLKCGMNKKDDGIFWALKRSSILKDVYTEADYAESERLASEEPLQNGEQVLINGEIYIAKVTGDFSDAVVFHKA